MAELVAVSDLHLGDRDENAGSVLGSLSACKNFAEGLLAIAGSKIKTLVINGDLFEACVPERSLKENFLHKTSIFGLYNSVIEDSQKFFACLTDRIQIESLIWIPGNHDLSLANAVYQGKRGLYSPTAVTLKSGDSWLHPDLSCLFGNKFNFIGCAYPNFVYRAEPGWPLAVFTHGHLFDDQVLDPDKGFLESIGLTAETGKLFPQITHSMVDETKGSWMKRLVDLTTSRILAIWPQNLDPIKEAVYNYVERRKIRIICKHRPSGIVCARSYDLTLSQLPNNLQWFVDGFMVEEAPILPTPRTTSYVVRGHTHHADFNILTSLDNAPFKVYDLGGWTRDAVLHTDNVPHTHVLLWDRFPSDPISYAFNVTGA